MTDLGGGPVAAIGSSRAQNGGSRAAGPTVPIVPGSAGRVTTPTDIMRRRREKEAERRAETDARQREQADNAERQVENQRRMSAERRAAAAAAAAGVAGAGGGGGGAGGAPLGETNPNRRSGGARRSGSDPTATTEAGERRRYDRVSSNPAARINPTTTSNQYNTGSNRAATEPQAAQRVMADGGSSLLPQPVTASRTRATSTSQPQPRPVPTQTSRAASATYSGQPQASQTRATSAPQTGGTNRAQAAPSAASYQRPGQSQTSATQQRSGTTSSFPHAFERWEQLSSHWEGLTSYWIKRLEGNSEELSNQPINQQLARQVTDLSAAGANLFHAVVELQRLRASSERKFQRWFFETRTEQEKTAERIAQLERELQEEKQARADEVANGARREAQKSSMEEALQVKRQAEQMVKEMKRELQISRDEARRGWEEIGRMEQAERDRTFSLKRGQPTLVGGVQVVPMPQGDSPGRQTRSSQGGLSSHPVGGHGGGGGGGDSREGGGEGGYGNFDRISETDTDPFTESGRGEGASSGIPPVPQVPFSSQQQPSYLQTSASAVSQGMSAATTGASSPRYRSTAPAVTAPSTTSGGIPFIPVSSSASGAAAFYQQHGSGTALHGGTIGATFPGAVRTTEADERSYVQSVDDNLSEEEYLLDEQGQVRRDAHGNPIPYPRGPASEESDEAQYIERERMYAQQYGSGSRSGAGGRSGGGGGSSGGGGVAAPVGGGPVASSAYGTTSNGDNLYSEGGQPDYSGTGYGWEALVPRHRHPTRLSDVLEEDERSRTSPSRASERSRGLH